MTTCDRCGNEVMELGENDLCQDCIDELEEDRKIEEWNALTPQERENRIKWAARHG